MSPAGVPPPHTPLPTPSKPEGRPSVDSLRRGQVPTASGESRAAPSAAAGAPPTTSAIIKEGYLTLRESQLRRVWKTRYFRCLPGAWLCFANNTDTQPRATLKLDRAASIEVHNKSSKVPHTLAVTGVGRGNQWIAGAESANEMHEVGRQTARFHSLECAARRAHHHRVSSGWQRCARRRQWRQSSGAQ